LVKRRQNSSESHSLDQITVKSLAASTGAPLSTANWTAASAPMPSASKKSCPVAGL